MEEIGYCPYNEWALHCYCPPTKLSVHHSIDMGEGRFPCDHYPWCIGRHCTWPPPPFQTWGLTSLMPGGGVVVLTGQRPQLVTSGGYITGDLFTPTGADVWRLLKCVRSAQVGGMHPTGIAFWLISLHIRSMWETICDALASWSGWKFGSKIPVCPILGFGHQPPSPLPPPPPRNWNLGISWHFKTFQFWLPQNPPPPEVCGD